jgi:hypothetical protein
MNNLVVWLGTSLSAASVACPHPPGQIRPGANLLSTTRSVSEIPECQVQHPCGSCLFDFLDLAVDAEGFSEPPLRVFRHPPGDGLSARTIPIHAAHCVAPFEQDGL